MKFLNASRSPQSLKVANSQELLAEWGGQGLPYIADEVSAVKLIKNSHYCLEGVIIFKPLTDESTGRRVTSQLFFKLIARKNYFSNRRVIKHFVSRLDPVGVRNDFPPIFLSIVIPWLQVRGYAAIYFPIHSAKRRDKFQRMLTELGVRFYVLNRVIFKAIVVDFDE